jgi:ActR/RegA family two-component response regulator
VWTDLIKMKPRASATNSRNSAPSSGYGNIATAVSAAKLGAVDYLAKPVDADDVAAALLAIDNKKVRPPENPMWRTGARGAHPAHLI